MIKLTLNQIIQNTSVIDVVNIHNQGNYVIENVLTDTRQINFSERGIFVALCGKNYDGHDFMDQAYNKGVKIFVIENISKVPEHMKEKCVFILVPSTVVFLAELSRLVVNYHKVKGLKVVAVAGSAGKTTTKNILKNMLEFVGFKVLSSKKSFNNEIGVPLTVFSLNSQHQILVLEMGMRGFNQIEYLCSYTDPDYGIITSIGPEHLEFVYNLKGVIRAESELTNYLLKKHGYFIIPSKIKGLYTNYSNFDFIPNKNSFIKNYSPTIKHTTLDIIIDRKKYNLKFEGIISLSTLVNFLFSLKLTQRIISDFLLVDKNAIDAYIKSILVNSSEILNSSIETDRFYFHKLSSSIYIISDYYNSNYLSLSENLKVVEKVFKYFDKVWLFVGDMLELGNMSRFYHAKIVRRISKYPSKVKVYYIGSNFYNLKDKFFDDAKYYLTVDDLLKNFPEIKKNSGKNLIFIKGSRALMLEKVYQKISDL
ncbi:MAG: UDP-N-acetylmuramoyl-tripeptide--D-alanyl-D-alanine ligase [bacterium]